MSDMMNEVSLAHWQLEMLQSIDAGLVVLDRQYRVQLWNSFMENHSSIRPGEAKDQYLFDLVKDLPEKWLRRKADMVFNLKNRSFTTWQQRPYVFKFDNALPLTGNTPYMYQNMTIIPLPSITTEVDHICLIIYDVTDMASSTLQMEKANAELTYLSQTDRLTGLYNRGHWEDLVRAEFARYHRTKQKCCMVMIDIDHFSEINNQYGHLAGDAALRHLAGCLNRTARETDMIGRYGGEEFGILLVDTDAAQAMYFAERLRKNVEKSEVDVSDNKIKYTISLGVAELTDADKRYESLLNRADDALYRSKNNGRNQTHLAE